MINYFEIWIRRESTHIDWGTELDPLTLSEFEALLLLDEGDLPVGDYQWIQIPKVLAKPSILVDLKTESELADGTKNVEDETLTCEFKTIDVTKSIWALLRNYYQSLSKTDILFFDRRSGDISIMYSMNIHPLLKLVGNEVNSIDLKAVRSYDNVDKFFEMKQLTD